VESSGPPEGKPAKKRAPDLLPVPSHSSPQKKPKQDTHQVSAWLDEKWSWILFSPGLELFLFERAHLLFSDEVFY
jgi:hypothetical protein